MDPPVAGKLPLKTTATHLFETTRPLLTPQASPEHWIQQELRRPSMASIAVFANSSYGL
jgi:hypothetical protein